MNDFIKGLKGKYGYDNPILLEELSKGRDDNARIRKLLSDADKTGDIDRAIRGVYYCSRITRLGTRSVIPSYEIAEKVYIDGDNGYYSGLSFENGNGLTSQVPNIREITTNNTSARVRTVSINKFKFILRKPRTMINAENKRVMPWMDYITYIDRELLMKNIDLVKTAFDGNADIVENLIKYYPARTAKIIMEEDLI